jgi:hypothetical protein
VVYYVCATIGVFVLLVAAVKGFFLVGIIKIGKVGKWCKGTLSREIREKDSRRSKGSAKTGHGNWKPTKCRSTVPLMRLYHAAVRLRSKKTWTF